jgi:eukaryotic-like serine/threonine-protein kinase
MTLIAGRYQPLDAARPGAPLRARDLQTAQSVILREVSLPQEGAEDALRRARAAAGIFHPSLVALFDVVAQPEGRALLAYEFVPAQTIAQAGGGQPFSVKRAAELVAEVSDAVAELHARGLAHGGISQSSVLVTLKGKAKLDRIGDPSLPMDAEPTAAGDLRALGMLLQDLVARSGTGVAGLPAIEVLSARARDGKFESAATLAALLRRL